MKLIDGHAMIQRVEALHKRGTVDLSYYNIVKEAVQMEPSVDAVPVVRCRDCKYYEVKDHWAYFKNVPVLAASDVPTCHRWGDGECKTSPDGYCFLGERWDDDATN